jgi:threonine dehydrogenase-like Zn-dependent dehydrogenase
MTTHTFAFDDMPKAFEMFANKADHVIKPLISF